MISYKKSFGRVRKIVFFLILSFLIFWGIWYRGKVLPGVVLGDIPFGGKSQEEAAKYLEDLTREMEISLFVDDSGQRRELVLNFGQLGIEYDVHATAQRLYEAGRSGSIFDRLFFRLSAPFVRTTVVPVYQLDSSRFVWTIESNLVDSIYPAVDASIVFGNEFEISNEILGKTYDREKLIKHIKNNIENLQNYPIDVEFVEVSPRVNSQNSRVALEKIKTLANQKVMLVFERESWSLSGAKLLDSLRFYPKGQPAKEYSLILPNTVLKFGPFNFANVQENTLEISIDDIFLDNFIDGIGNSIDVETVDASLVFEGGKISQFVPARDGRKLDRDLTKQLVLSKVSIENVSGEEETIINLPVSIEKARIASGEINSLGIKELIGRGLSYFAGSIPNRVHNLTLGSARISGTIVKPGETFSFNRSVGEVSGATGYKQAYVISAGRTVLDDGGGICQVSTTVFRAALEAGLPIVARTAHAYRVGYYEQKGFKPGLDATVWAPAVDLVFKNDTQNHILVQAIVDPKNAKLEVDIYGTADGRRVEVSEPVVSNIKPAPEPRYQDDPTLPKGTTKQVDFAAPGATSIFTRKVYRGNELMIDDVFKSIYRPWQAVYLVGTGG